MIKTAIISIVVFSFCALTGVLHANAQEVVYVLPVLPGSGGGASGTSIEEPPRFEGEAEYETDFRRRGLWRPRARRDLFARPGDIRNNIGTGSDIATRDIAGDGGSRGNTARPVRNLVRNAPVEGDLATSNLRSGAMRGGSGFQGTIQGQGGNRLRGVGEAFSSALNGGGLDAGDGTQNPAGRIAGGTMVSGALLDERQPRGAGGNTQRRTASSRQGASSAAVSDLSAVDAAEYGPPEDFGITAQGAVDLLTGDILPARAPLVTGSAGQPRQSALTATTSAAFSSAVGAAGTRTSLLVEGAITTVRDRPRPQWDSLGTRWGRFLVRPSIEIESEYTDNAALSASNRKSDLRAVLRPSISADSDFSRHGLSFNLASELVRHARLKSEDYVQLDASVLGRIDVRRNMIIDTELRYGLSQEERDTISTPAGPGKRPFVHAYNASVRATRRFNRLSVSLRGTIDHTDYEAASSAGGDDRDYSDFSTTARLSYDVRPGVLVYGQGRYSVRRHRQRFDNAGTARNSDGITAEIGSTLSLGRHMRADAAFGFIHRKYDDAALANVSAFSANADIAWNVSELTTLRAGISTVVDETTIANASANVVREVVFGVDHELRRNFIIGAELLLSDTKVIGSSIRDTAYVVDLNADYRLNRNAAITVHLTRRMQDSTRANADYTEHTATIGLNLRL